MGSLRGQYEQKEVVKPADRFKTTTEVLLGGTSKPVVAHKQAKSGKTKEFALKKFGSANDCAREKLYYDLLRLCGVKVPKTYILADEKGELTILASRIEEGYKNLLYWVGGQIQEEKKVVLNQEVQAASFSKQCVLAEYTSNKKDKPIIGLFENLPVFLFLQDWDAVGSAFQNVGLIEGADHFQAVKIDPGCCNMTKKFDPSNYWFRACMETLAAKKLTNYPGLPGNANVFKHTTSDQMNDGMFRVANISDEQLRAVVYNKKIPSLSQEDRDDIYEVLTFRCNAYRKLLQKSLNWKPGDAIPVLKSHVSESKEMKSIAIERNLFSKSNPHDKMVINANNINDVIKQLKNYHMDREISISSWGYSFFHRVNLSLRTYLLDMTKTNMDKAIKIVSAICNGTPQNIEDALSEHRLLSCSGVTTGRQIYEGLRQLQSGFIKKLLSKM